MVFAVTSPLLIVAYPLLVVRSPLLIVGYPLLNAGDSLLAFSPAVLPLLVERRHDVAGSSILGNGVGMGNGLTRAELCSGSCGILSAWRPTAVPASFLRRGIAPAEARGWALHQCLNAGLLPVTTVLGVGTCRVGVNQILLNGARWAVVMLALHVEACELVWTQIIHIATATLIPWLLA